MKTTVLTLGVISALFLCGSASAQDTPYAHPVSIPGISSQVTVFTGAPQGFDPLTASDEELQTYGYPRRPDPNEAKPYSMWKRAVSAERITPELGSNPGKFHRPNQKVGTLGTIGNTANASSGNWSGYSLVGGSPKFDEVVGVWIVPNVATEASGTNGYSSMWVGIDGNCKCNDLIQDGTEQQFTGGSAKYYAWIEFIPQNEIPINNFAVQPGDVIYAYSAVISKSGKIYGSYYMVNYNTNKAVSATIAMPSGDVYSGASAEWIVERTEVNGSFQNPLPHYAYAYMDDAWAYRSGSSHAITYLSESNQNITMVNSSGKHLSRVYEEDGESMWFQWLAYK